MELSILIPCLNERETIGRCVEKALGFLARRGVDGEVVVVDNGSADGSEALARAAGASVVSHPQPGYGRAILAGLSAVQGEYFIFGYADDSYDFSNLDGFLDELRAGSDLVIGNRFLGGIFPGAMPPLHQYLGNPVLSGIGRLLFSSPVGDFHCGLRGGRRETVLALDLRCPGMEFASEMIVRATLFGLKISEVPTTLQPDGRSRPPHLRTWRDGWRHLRLLTLYRPRWVLRCFGFALLTLGGLAVATAQSGVSAPSGGEVQLLGGVALAAGFQCMLLSELAARYAVQVGLHPRSAFSKTWFFGRELEAGLLIGATLIGLGLAGLLGAIQGVGGAAMLSILLGTQALFGGAAAGLLAVGATRPWGSSKRER